MILFLAAALAASSSQASCPDSATVYGQICRAVQASGIGEHRQSATAFERAALDSAPGEPETARLWAAAGNMWIAAGEPGRAAAALDRALYGTGLQAEQRGEALLDRARAAEAQNDFKTARAKLKEAEQTISGDPFLWYFSAALAIREGDVATAKSSINRALSLEPDDPTLLFEAGHVAHFAGETAAARAYWTRASTIDPNGRSGAAARDALALLDSPAAVQKQGEAAK